MKKKNEKPRLFFIFHVYYIGACFDTIIKFDGNPHTFKTCPLMVGIGNKGIILSWNCALGEIMDSCRSTSIPNKLWESGLQKAFARLVDSSLNQYHIQYTDILPQLGRVEKYCARGANPSSSSNQNLLVPHILKDENDNRLNLYQTLSFILFGNFKQNLRSFKFKYFQYDIFLSKHRDIDRGKLY